MLDPFDLSNSDSVTLGKAFEVFATRLADASGVKLIQAYSHLAKGTRLAPKMQTVANQKILPLPSEIGPSIEINFGSIDRLKPYGSCAVYLVPDRQLDAAEVSLISKAFRRFYLSVLVNMRTRFRDHAIEQCHALDNAASLAKKIRELTKGWMNAEGVSVFLLDRSASFLQLQSATSFDSRAGRGLPMRQGEVTFVTECHQSGEAQFLQEDGVPLSTFPERHYRGVYQCFAPIRLQERHRGPKTRSLGVVRVTNPNQHGVQASSANANVRPLTWEDYFLLDFMMENFYLYFSALYSVEQNRRRFDRATHAIDLAADASLHMARNIERELFGDSSDKAKEQERAEDDQAGDVSVDPVDAAGRNARVRNYLRSLEAYLVDLNDQVLLNTGLEGHISGPKDRSLQVENFVNEALRPLARMAQWSAILHDGKRTPTLSRIDTAMAEALLAAGISKVPTVYGQSKHLQLVFRNLLDNSVKYCPRPRANIKISLRFEAKYAIVLFADDGMVIPPHEVARLFTEGFRGKRAERMSNRGLGIGLHASREILDYYDGKISHVHTDVGTTFEVALRIAQGGRDGAGTGV